MLDELMPDPWGLSEVVVTGRDLTLADVVAVARHGAKVRLSAEAVRRAEESRHVVSDMVERGERVYGLTTGFGSLRDVAIPLDQVRQLQHNLMRSHAAGVGHPLDEDVVRAMMLLRLNTLASGHSGVRPQTMERIATLLNERVFPYVPSRGSVGASGDLAPLAHLGLVIMGDPAGRIWAGRHQAPSRRGSHREGATHEDFVPLGEGVLEAACGLGPYQLEAKEGLALTNGTQLTTALGALGLYDALVALEAAVVAAACSLEAIKGCSHALDERLAAVRGFPEQAEVARLVSALMEDSRIQRAPASLPALARAARLLQEVGQPPGVESLLAQAQASLDEAQRQVGRGEDPSHHVQEATRCMALAVASLAAQGAGRARRLLVEALSAAEGAIPWASRVQDDYSFRCIPQVLGASLWAIRAALSRVSQELNAVTDNPLVFPQDPRVVSGGNFHAQPVAIALDLATMAVTDAASIAERRVAKLLDSRFNAGLPAHLALKGGLHSGFMVAQYTAAALVSECKVLAHPACVDSIPTCESTEDHVSMGPLAGFKLRSCVDHLEAVVAIELVAACQALDLWRPLSPGRGVDAVHQLLRRSGIPFVTEDVALYPLVHQAVSLVRQGAIHDAVRVRRGEHAGGDEPPAGVGHERG